jgi:hypothetical protein
VIAADPVTIKEPVVLLVEFTGVMLPTLNTLSTFAVPNIRVPDFSCAIFTLP